MKSLSLDSPESSELHGQMRRRQQPPIPGTVAMASSSVAGGTYYHGGSGTQLEHSTPPSNNSRLHSPSSPSHQGRKLLYATRGMRGGSVDLPDDMDKSQSSASTSPCPSPVTVIDTSDPDWWKGKAMGRVGYFPSKYVVRLNANEKPLQVTHNLQVSDGERGENMTLLRDQIVIQTGNEMNGMVMVRSADNRQGYCPVKYLQEPEEPPCERDKPPQKSSLSSKLLDKGKRKIRIVVTDSAGEHTSYNNLPREREPKNVNVDYNGDYDLYKTQSFALDGNGRSKNDKNWENWERIREQKLERMKHICFESYRQSKRDKMQQWKPKPRQLDPSWYTDNIYSNHSEDLEDDYIPDCLKYGGYRKLRNIREHDELFIDTGEDEFADDFEGEVIERRGEGEGSAGYGLQRSFSCKEFHYPKSQSYSFGVNAYEEGLADAPTISGPPPPPSLPPSAPHPILKNRTNVPKSYSFSATSSTSAKTMPFDVMDYEVPQSMTGKSRRERQEAFRKSMGFYCSNSLDETALSGSLEAHTCCAREHCTNAKCLLDDIYSDSYDIGGPRRPWRRVAPSSSSLSGFYGAGASGGSNRNLHETDWWEERNNHRVAGASRYSLLLGREQPQPPPPTVICCCAADTDYCYQRQQQHHIARPARARYHCPGHHPAAEEEEHMHCRAMAYDTDLDHFIRDERERLMSQDKFLDEDERYLSSSVPRRQYSLYRRPTRSKSMLEVQPPSRYDEDSCSDSTEMDLRDFNIDLEKYWEELEKPPSPIDLDMQRRNMQSNLKVKNVNVGCYNNGQPIDLHDREQERMMIKKSLLEGMPSPPQVDHSSPTDANNVASNFHFFEDAGSPLHRSFNYGHKVYPAAEVLPSYQYNNFYPEQNSVQTQQPTSSGHHTSAGGHSALSLINNIFSIYKPNKYAPQNCHYNNETKPEPCKKMNVPSTRRPLGAPHSEYMHSMKRPLIVSTEQPHFKIIPEKTGLKISPFYNYDHEEYEEKPQTRLKLTSTARPLMLPH
uniref:SH3 domain-containing protein n=1 Tax=Glossina pallidipes TaxID=7398 RepID=A0A1A9ZDZ3_GLOPL